MRNFFVPAGLLLACTWHAPAQPLLVGLNVVAVDKQGQSVTDLKPEDLKVLDDGKRVSIVQFRANDNRHPLAPTALAPHEYSNRAAAAAPGATMIVFDLLNGNFTERETTILSLAKALNGVESAGNVSLYMLTNKGALFPIHPLPERGAGAPAPDENWSRQAKALLDAAVLKVYGLRPVDDQDIGIRAITTFKMLQAVGSELSSLPGRKNLVWITNGFPLQADLGGLCRTITIDGAAATCSGNYIDFTPIVRRLSAQLDAAGVAMYPVDEWAVDGGERVAVKALLDTFADLTGGRSYPNGGAKMAIPDALQASHWNYTVTYEPQPKSWDGKFHKVRVTTARKGVQLLFEQGYAANPPVDESAALLDAGASFANDLQSIGLRATVNPGAAPHTLHIQLRIDATGLTLAHQGDRYSGQLGLLYAGLTAEGPKRLSKASNLDLNWTAEQYDAACKNGIPLSADVPAPEGVRQLRIVVVDSRSNRMGSLTIPVS